MTNVPSTVPDERLWEEKISSVVMKIDYLAKSIESNLHTLGRTVEDSNKSIVKILDDHEFRLRESVKVDGDQGRDIATLRVQVAEVQGQITALNVRIGTVLETMESNKRAELGTWQRVSLELMKMLLFGGSAGGATLGALKLLGLF